ncbi:MAG: pentapeptide repeat-containing protein [Candidatus Gastranaerophilales bacterium]|nr:pentapeptide repeat-containing protein [Candidatus Gastranaerophilales bacterium]
MAENLFDLLKNGNIDEFNEEIKNCTEDLTEADFASVEADGALFKDLDLTCCDFSESNFSNSSFEDCDLTSATFARAELSGVAFNNAILNGTKFNNANISYCDFTDADVSGADLSEADVSDSDLSLAQNLNQCSFDKFTVWPDSDKLPSDFDGSYQEDLAALNDEEPEGNQDY